MSKRLRSIKNERVYTYLVLKNENGYKTEVMRGKTKPMSSLEYWGISKEFKKRGYIVKLLGY